MNVTTSGNLMTVRVTGTFFSTANIMSFSGFWEPGDLYISSTGWKALGSSGPHFATDTFTSNEGWNYVVGNGPQGKGVYNILNFPSITMTNIDGAYGTYRADQAWQGGYGAYVTSADVSVDGTGMTFEFSTLDSTGAYYLGDQVGLHWTMQCGNDVVEGEVPVPEPTTILLLGVGLIGVTLFGRRKFRTNK
jgi:hypothetical protein